MRIAVLYDQIFGLELKISYANQFHVIYQLVHYMLTFGLSVKKREFHALCALFYGLVIFYA